MWFWLFSLFWLASANEGDADSAIVVEAYRDIQIYVSDVQVIDKTQETDVETVVDETSAFVYTGQFWRNAKVPAGVNSWQPITLGERDVKVYNSETIEYVWDNCNYEREPLKCAVTNDHYYLETIVTVDDNQLVVRSTLYDSDAQVVNSSTRTNDKVIKWIRQQEITVTQQNGAQQYQFNRPEPICTPRGCIGVQTQMPNNLAGQNIYNKPKEEMPLKWEIPHTLTNSIIRQTLMGVWIGAKLYK